MNIIIKVGDRVFLFVFAIRIWESELSPLLAGVHNGTACILLTDHTLASAPHWLPLFAHWLVLTHLFSLGLSLLADWHWRGFLGTLLPTLPEASLEVSLLHSHWFITVHGLAHRVSTLQPFLNSLLSDYCVVVVVIVVVIIIIMSFGGILWGRFQKSLFLLMPGFFRGVSGLRRLSWIISWRYSIFWFCLFPTT